MAKKVTMSAKQVRAVRKKLGLTQQQAADRIGVTLAAWQHWEYGKRTPSSSAARLIELLRDEKI